MENERHFPSIVIATNPTPSEPIKKYFEKFPL